MTQSFSLRYHLPVITIQAGECYSSDQELIICTLLGSCVSVALLDPVARIGGMNHFMLAKRRDSSLIAADQSGRYGVNAMELLINQLMKQGAQRSRLQAKVFGGGHVLASRNYLGIPDNNINFAIEFLGVEGIPVVAQDTGGSHGRKIWLFTRSGEILLRRFAGALASSTVHEELAYLKQIRTNQKHFTGDVTLF